MGKDEEPRAQVKREEEKPRGQKQPRERATWDAWMEGRGVCVGAGDLAIGV